MKNKETIPKTMKKLIVNTLIIRRTLFTSSRTRTITTTIPTRTITKTTTITITMRKRTTL